MKVIRHTDGEKAFEKNYGNAQIVFLGGNCRGRDWRVDVTRRLGKADVVLINPRREDFPHPSNMPDEHASQVAWEREAIDKSDVCIFWLGEGLANQAARVEIGYALGKGKTVIIGADTGFLGLEHLSAFSGLVLSTSINGLMDRLESVIRDGRAA